MIKKHTLILIMSMLLSKYAFANLESTITKLKSTTITNIKSTTHNLESTTRGNFGIGILLPFPIVLEFNIWNFDVDLGIYSGANNLFEDWKTFFFAIDYIFSTNNNFAGTDILDFSVGCGSYGTIWLSQWEKNHTTNGPVSLGARLPLILNLAITKKKFDVFLKLAPGLGINIWSQKVGFRWEIFAALGIRFWFK
ncbi:DUF3996 domain-containing protein [Borrelia sp. HM]|uniref:BAPKO_0422 family outer member beta-barrel protein n=1 Tax=Borrelia sp. HM TaxID=1882662 RepID=UPI001C79922C|nr:DUF3996 domain-containing protein [Borrelia sp. HM]BCR21983.1 hypothetical protein BKFM_00563 [Borrelia sp. HM]